MLDSLNTIITNTIDKILDDFASFANMMTRQVPNMHFFIFRISYENNIYLLELENID